MVNIAKKLIYKKIGSLFENRDIFDEIINGGHHNIKLPSLASLNKKQKKALKIAANNKKNLFLILHGGIRSGKTYIAIYIFILRVLEAKGGSLFLATGYNLSVLRNNIEQIFDEFKMVYNRDYTYNSLLYRYQIGNKTIRLCGANNKRSYYNIRGCTATGWYANEIVLQEKSVIYECIKRVSTVKRFKIWDTNPASSQHYIYRDFILKAQEKGIEELSFNIYDNLDNISESYVEEQRNLLSINDQKVYLDGLWCDNLAMPFYPLATYEYDLQRLIYSFCDRIAFLDPATGHGENCSKTALAIVFHDRVDDQDFFYFCGKSYKGLWTDSIIEITTMLNKLQVDSFYYENNLIGNGVIERDFEFTNRFRGNIKSLRNSRDKIARISSLIAPIEKKTLLGLHFCDKTFLDEIKYANLSDKENLDSIDALECAYRILTT